LARYNAELSMMQSESESLGKEIELRKANNAERDKALQEGRPTDLKHLATKELEEQKAKVDKNIEELEGGLSNKAVETIKKERQNLAVLKEQEQQIIGRLQEETGITDDVAKKIMTVAEEKKNRKKTIAKANSLEEGIKAAKPRDFIEESVRKIMSSVYGEQYDFRAVSGYDFDNVGDAISYYDTLQEVIYMYNDIIKKAEADLKAALPKGKAESIIRDMEILTSD